MKNLLNYNKPEEGELPRGKVRQNLGGFYYD